MAHQVNHLIDEIERSSSSALVLGAGISIPSGIPAGYRLPIEFGRNHQSLMQSHGLKTAWMTAEGSKDWHAHKAFVDQLVSDLPSSPSLLQTLVDWLNDYPVMAGGTSDDHAILVLAWMKGIFKHMVTTNWDFLLESQVDQLFDNAYNADDPLAPVPFSLSDGRTCDVPADHLFHLMPLDGDESSLAPRWDIVADVESLNELGWWSRPTWKIHGSPFLLYCSQCGGMSRWKHVKGMKIGDECPKHPGVILTPEITFWENGVDRERPKVWRALQERLRRCKLIVAVGFSGADTYIREELERHANLWVVDPSDGDWTPSKVNHIRKDVTEFAEALYPLLDSPRSVRGRWL
jgi:NAD-dependent SIR2 family protein deacetylase